MEAHAAAWWLIGCGQLCLTQQLWVSVHEVFSRIKNLLEVKSCSPANFIMDLILAIKFLWLWEDKCLMRETNDIVLEREQCSMGITE